MQPVRVRKMVVNSDEMVCMPSKARLLAGIFWKMKIFVGSIGTLFFNCSLHSLVNCKTYKATPIS